MILRCTVRSVRAQGFPWVGNHPGIDLCNTRPVRLGERVELLPDFDALVEWCRQAGVPVPDAALRSGRRAKSDAVAFARDLRELLRGVLEAAAPGDAAVAALNRLLDGEVGVLHVHAATDAGDPVTLCAGTGVAQLRLDLAVAVLDIFRRDLRRVHRCANPACVLLFLDVSKAGRRRWCDMAVCGNRAKAAAHYARRR